MSRQAARGVANWLTWKACDPSRIFFAMTVWCSEAILPRLYPPIRTQFGTQFWVCLVAAPSLYLIAWSIGYLIARLIALLIAKNCSVIAVQFAIELLCCYSINVLA